MNWNNKKFKYKVQFFALDPNAPFLQNVDISLTFSSCIGSKDDVQNNNNNNDNNEKNNSSTKLKLEIKKFRK